MNSNITKNISPMPNNRAQFDNLLLPLYIIIVTMYRVVAALDSLDNYNRNSVVYEDQITQQYSTFHSTSIMLPKSHNPIHTCPFEICKVPNGGVDAIKRIPNQVQVQIIQREPFNSFCDKYHTTCISSSHRPVRRTTRTMLQWI